MNYRSTLLALLLLAFTATGAKAQLEDLRIFGYAQTLGYYERQQSSFSGMLPPGVPASQVNERTSFSLQQLNVMFNKPFAERFNIFLNFQYTLGFSTQRGWGDFSVEEAWASYEHSDAFTIKAGMLLPTFNNLNEIKNRTALLPYLFRPSVYETNLSSFISFEDYLPERSFLQVNGTLPISTDLRFEYAANIGNPETSYIASKNGASTSNAAPRTSGESTVNFFSYGGRVGIRNAAETFKLGLSGTLDRDNRRDTTRLFSIGRPEIIAPLGDVERLRLGGDVSFTLGNFAFEGEYIGVFYNSARSNQLNKQFFYGNALYNITDQIYVYGGYSYFSLEGANENAIATNGVHAVSAGAGWRVNQWFVPKIQYVRIMPNFEGNANITFDYLYLGLSIIF
ncbi:MAG: hypothetical protein H9535_20870 [Ignavibacteria bacterium]|nr:hypothetical protein [Ignavibacteria bacterium]